LTHLVICWLDEAIKEDEIEMVIDETRKLSSIPGVQDFSVGKPVQSDRAVVDDSFTFAIAMRFRSQKEMESYLTHDLHVGYVNEILKPRASKITVYDF